LAAAPVRRHGSARTTCTLGLWHIGHVAKAICGVVMNMRLRGKGNAIQPGCLIKW